MTKLYEITSVAVADDDEPDARYPGFLVKGSYRGRPFEVDVFVELDGRDAEVIHKGGYNLQDAWSEFPDHDDVELYEAIYASGPYDAAVKSYGLAR